MFLENSQKFTGKHLCQSLFFIKFQAETCSFIKKRTLAQVFSCEFCEISKNSFFTEYLRWLLLLVAWTRPLFPLNLLVSSLCGFKISRGRSGGGFNHFRYFEKLKTYVKEILYKTLFAICEITKLKYLFCWLPLIIGYLDYPAPGPQPSYPALSLRPPKNFQPAQPPPTQSPVTMIMCTLLLMVYGLFEPCWLILMPHVHVLKELPYCLTCI